MQTVLCWLAIAAFCGLALVVGIVGTVSLVLLDALRTLKQWIEK